MKEWQKRVVFLLGMHAERLLEAQGHLGGVYIAQILMDEETSIEVESDPDTIVFSFNAPSCEAKEIVEFLKSELGDLGVSTFKTYEEYERTFLEKCE